MLPHAYSNFKKDAIASFAVRLAEGAALGDQFCLAAWARCGGWLGNHVGSVARKLPHDMVDGLEPLLVVCAGSVFRSAELLRKGVEAKLQYEGRPQKGFRFVRLTETAAVGAALYACRYVFVSFSLYPDFFCFAARPASGSPSTTRPSRRRSLTSDLCTIHPLILPRKPPQISLPRLPMALVSAGRMLVRPALAPLALLGARAAAAAKPTSGGTAKIAVKDGPKAVIEEVEKLFGSKPERVLRSDKVRSFSQAFCKATQRFSFLSFFFLSLYYYFIAGDWLDGTFSPDGRHCREEGNDDALRRVGH